MRKKGYILRLCKYFYIKYELKADNIEFKSINNIYVQFNTIKAEILTEAIIYVKYIRILNENNPNLHMILFKNKKRALKEKLNNIFNYLKEEKYEYNLLDKLFIELNKEVEL